MTQGQQIDPKAVATVDPFLRDIPPALLNSADIAAYAEALSPGLFEPFIKEKRLKPATYEISFEGDVYLWQKDRSFLEKLNPWRDDQAKLEKLEQHKLTKDGTFTIPANSIVYIFPVTYFRIPLFLALRFNLHIKLVHRGLLLGTGPIVDPGFAGRLLIPVHNLTSQPLTVHGSAGFIWVEVTKISPVREGTSQVPFNRDKSGQSAEAYLKNANNLNPIVSTLHVTSERLNLLWGKLSMLSILGVVALVALTYGCWSLINDTHHYVTDTRKASIEDLDKLQKRQDTQQTEKASVEELEKLRKRQDALQTELDILKNATVRPASKTSTGTVAK